jgi:hypothetical protein
MRYLCKKQLVHRGNEGTVHKELHKRTVYSKYGIIYFSNNSGLFSQPVCNTFGALITNNLPELFNVLKPNRSVL